MQNKLFVRIVAVVLAVLMCGGVLVGAIRAFAAPANILMVPAIGDNLQVKWIVIAAVIAVIVIAALVIVPIISKNKKKK